MDKKTFRIQTGMESLNDILGDIAKGLGIERGMKEITLLNMWSKIVGPRFKNSSKAISVVKKGKSDVLFVAVKSSVVSQELYMFKADILKKIKPSADSLGFNIIDINFSIKSWEVELKNEEKEENYIEFYRQEPDKDELFEIKVPDSIVESIRESIKQQELFDEKLKSRMFDTIIKDIKTQIWRKNKGFPSCDNCGIPLNRYVEGQKNLCPSCKYSS